MSGKAARLFLVACLLLCCTACVVAVHSPPARVRPVPPPPAPPPVRVDVGLFYDDLAPHGAWHHVEPYGWVWSPYGVSAAWRPYSEGRWVYSDYGWTWVSDWDWGWAPFHYGRWAPDARHGWVWIPGTQWAPAWVAWRHGGGWVGWAPLPPQARWRAGAGLDLGGADIDVIIRPASWCFVEDRRLLEPRLASRIALSTRNATLARSTRHVTKYVMHDRHVVNRSIDLDPIQRVHPRPVPRYRVVDDEPAGRATRSRFAGKTLRVFRPRIDDAPPQRTPRATASEPHAPRASARAAGQPRRAEPPQRGSGSPGSDRAESRPDPESSGATHRGSSRITRVPRRPEPAERVPESAGSDRVESSRAAQPPGATDGRRERPGEAKRSTPARRPNRGAQADSPRKPARKEKEEQAEQPSDESDEPAPAPDESENDENEKKKKKKNKKE